MSVPPFILFGAAALAKGTYILKVQINGITENWKVIKQ